MRGRDTEEEVRHKEDLKCWLPFSPFLLLLPFLVFSSAFLGSYVLLFAQKQRRCTRVGYSLP